jgi:undecaprenyl-diphosphatase
VRLAGIIIIGTVPAAVLGFIFEDYIEAAFGSIRMTSLMLLVTAAVLFLTRVFKHGNSTVNLSRGFIIGVAQSVALLPGISRSGSTISTGLFLGVAPSEAAEFSFLLSLPAVFGAGVLKLSGMFGAAVNFREISVYAIGALAAFIVGYLSIAWLMKIVRRGQFFYFGAYCLVIGITGLVLA